MTEMRNRPSAWRLFFAAVFSVFLAEVAVMLLLPPLAGQLPPLLLAVADAFLLICLLVPALLFFLYRPLMREVRRAGEAEENLLYSESYLRSVIDTEPECVKFLDKEGVLVDMNPAGLQMIDAGNIEQVRGHSIYGLVVPAHREAFKSLTEAVCRGERGTLLFEITSLAGKSVWLETHAAPFRDEKRGETLLLGVTRDVTQRIEAERELRASEERFRSLVDQATDAFFLFSLDGSIVDVNRRCCDSLGYSKDEILGLTVFDIFDPFTPARLEETTRRLLDDGVPATFEWEHRRKDGSRFPVEARIGMIHVSNRPLILALARDISIRRRAEEEKAALEHLLLRSQKMEAVGTLAGGIAHDFNNILSAILGYTELVALDVPEDSQHHKYLQEVVTATMRAKGIVQQILTFSRQEEETLKPLLLQLLVKETIKLLRSSIPSSIEIREEVDSRCGSILADPGQLRQAFMNLASNAQAAMKEGGILEIRLEQVDLGRGDLAGHPSLSPGTFARLTVSDTGQGMPPDVLERIFDPYYTTGESRGGTGLGLSVVHGIVSRHGGFLHVESSPGKGTAFSLFFPLAVAEETGAAAVSADLPAGRERILFVDDEPTLARLGHRFLERLGYRVESFSSSADALDRFRGSVGVWDLVITDLTMPQITGDVLAGEIMKLRPGLPVIICTGYGEEAKKDTLRHIGVTSFLFKPVNQKNLAFAVREALDSPGTDSPPSPPVLP